MSYTRILHNMTFVAKCGIIAVIMLQFQSQNLLQFQSLHLSQLRQLVAFARKLCISYNFHNRERMIACEGYHNIVKPITMSMITLVPSITSHLYQISQLVVPLVTTFTKACETHCKAHHKQSRVFFSFNSLNQSFSLLVYASPSATAQTKTALEF